MLTSAGVAFSVAPALVDEESVKAALQHEKATALHCAETLAELKAVKVSRAHPAALVIGADTMLECDGVWFDKPEHIAQAKDHLRTLSGKTHVLPSAVVVAQNGQRIWHHLAMPRLTMRTLSDDFIDAYFETTGDAVLSSVGAYHLEGLGAQLFKTTEGDFFTILGLSLLPLLGFLREHRVVMS